MATSDTAVQTALTGVITEGTSGDNKRDWAILAGLLVPHVACTVFVAARAYTRLVLLRKWFVDDTLIVLAWVFSSAVCVVYSVAAESPDIHNAVGSTAYGPVDFEDGTNAAVSSYWLQTYTGLICYQLCLCLTKLSILAFYLRMFHAAAHPRERWLTWASMSFVLLYGLPLCLMSVLQCHPAADEFFGIPMKCFTFFPLLVASASLHTIMDAWLIVMAVPAVLRLRLPPRQRAALAVVLSLGVFVIAASLTRLELAIHAGYLPEGAGGSSVRVANTLIFFVMTVIECDVAIICASAPTLRQLLAHLWPRIWLSEASKRRSYTNGGGGGGDGNAAGGTGELTSANLTAISYHGYPWVTKTSLAGDETPPPMPRLPTPTPPIPARSPLRALRSTSSWTRGRGMPGDDGVVLLQDTLEPPQPRQISAYYQHFLPPMVEEEDVEWRPKRFAMYVQEPEHYRGVVPTTTAAAITTRTSSSSYGYGYGNGYGHGHGYGHRHQPSPVLSTLSRGSTALGARSSSASTALGSVESVDAVALKHSKSTSSSGSSRYDDWGWEVQQL